VTPTLSAEAHDPLRRTCGFSDCARPIAKAWIEETIRDLDETETTGRALPFLKFLPDRNVLLRVVTPASGPEDVTTAYFEGTKPCTR
jgi:hypothetical protein